MILGALKGPRARADVQPRLRSAVVSSFSVRVSLGGASGVHCCWQWVEAHLLISTKLLCTDCRRKHQQAQDWASFPECLGKASAKDSPLISCIGKRLDIFDH